MLRCGYGPAGEGTARRAGCRYWVGGKGTSFSTLVFRLLIKISLSGHVFPSGEDGSQNFPALSPTETLAACFIIILTFLRLSVLSLAFEVCSVILMVSELLHLFSPRVSLEEKLI